MLKKRFRELKKSIKLQIKKAAHKMKRLYIGV